MKHGSQGPTITTVAGWMGDGVQKDKRQLRHRLMRSALNTCDGRVMDDIRGQWLVSGSPLFLFCPSTGGFLD